MGDTTKRREVFKYFKDLGKDIIFLQETHCTQEKEKMWSNEWGRKIWFSHGTSAAKGVAVLIKRNFPAEIRDCTTLFEGRVIMLVLRVDEADYLLINVYGPNDDNPSFYLDLFKQIEEKEVIDFLIVGDLNVTLNFEKDTKGCVTDSHFKKREILKNFMDLQEVTDVWRSQNPEKYQFSWKKSEDRKVTSRLDYFLTSRGITARVKKTEINPGFRTDHCRVDLNLNLSSLQRGKKVWKFNKTLLYDKDFVKGMNEIIDQHVWAVKQNISPAQNWEYLKLQITTYASGFAAQRAKGKSKLIEMLENKIKKLDEKILNSEQGNQRNLLVKSCQKTKNFLENEYAEKTAQAIFRSKSRFYNEGEKNSKYFFNLEKANYNAKCIRFLENDDGSTVSEPKEILKEEARYFQKIFTESEPERERQVFTNETIHKLSEEEKKDLDKNITLEEISEALFEMKNDKTPGVDGLPVEF